MKSVARYLTRTIFTRKGLGLSVNLLLVLTLVTPLAAPAALAQATTGSIRGVVTDQSGAVVAGATVTAKNQATGVQTAPFRSTGEGIYNLPNLIPGTYTLTVESANFKRAVFTDIEVRVGQEVTIDAALQPGGVTETVTITASSEEVVNKESAQISANFESRKVQELPSNLAGAGIDTLALLVPGVVPGLGAGTNNGTTLSVNGNRQRSNNFTVDGQDNNDLSVGGPVFFVDNQDTVADFQVVTNNFSAQYGRNQGAIVNIVTKGGTNEFHGSMFWFHRDQKNFDSLTNIEKRSGQDQPLPLLANIYGGTIGGPIIKDRAFFFASYQLQTQRATAIGRGAGLALLPSEFDRLKATFPNNAAIRAVADFGAFAITDLGVVRPRTDLTGAVQTVTVGGRTFQAGGPFDVLVLPLNPALPATGANAVGFQAAVPEREFATPFDQPEYTARGDVKLTERDNLWGSYLYQDGTTGNAFGASNGFTGDALQTNHKAGINWTRQVSSRSLNNFFFSYSKQFLTAGGGCEGLKGCLPDITNYQAAYPSINFAGVTGAFTGIGVQAQGVGAAFPQGRQVWTYQFADTYSMTRGRHQMVMGADIRRIITDATVLFNITGAFGSFNAARLVQNNPGTVNIAAGEPTVRYPQTDQFYFFQDDWKLRDNLTLNLGLRYEYSGQPGNTLHELTRDRESDPATAFWRQTLPIESRIIPKLPADKNNFAPRLGFAWSPRFGSDGLLGKVFGDDATVIRGGYGIAYDPAFYNIFVFLQTGAPVVFANTISNPATPSAANPVLFPVPDDLTAGGVLSFAQGNNLIARNILDPRYLDQNVLPSDFKSPYAQQWSIGIQRQLGRRNVVEARYLGTHGVGLFQNTDLNPRIDRLVNGFTATAGGQTINFPAFANLVPSGLRPITCTNVAGTPDNEGVCNGRILPGFGNVSDTGNYSQSMYHSLQTRYNGRLFEQLTMGATYTWSKALDNASEIVGFATGNTFAQHPFNITDAERGYSSFDRRHVMTLNGIWDIPVFREQNGFLGKALGGWQINGVYMLASGQRFSVGNGFTQALNARGIPTYNQFVSTDRTRPFYGNPSAPRDTVAITGIDALLAQTIVPFFLNVQGVTPTTDLYLLNDLNNGIVTPVSANAVRYVLNGPGAALRYGSPYGNVPRNSERGPLLNQLNMAFFKNTRVGERFNVQLRAEFFNILNHPNPGAGIAIVNGLAPARNAINAGVAGAAFNAFEDIELARRVVQLGLRVTF